MKWVVRIPSRNPGEWTYLGDFLGCRREALALTHAHLFHSREGAKAELEAWFRDLAYRAPEVAGTLPSRLRDATILPIDPTTTGAQLDGAGGAGPSSEGRPGLVPGGEGAGEVVAGPLSPGQRDAVGPIGPVEHTTAPRGRPEGEGDMSCPAVPDGATPSPSEAVPASRHPDTPGSAAARSAPPSEPPTGRDRSAVVDEARWSKLLLVAEQAMRTDHFELSSRDLAELLTRALLVGRVVRNAHNGRWPAPRWVHVQAVTALGSTSAASLCREYGLDPDEILGAADDPEADDAF